MTHMPDLTRLVTLLVHLASPLTGGYGLHSVWPVLDYLDSAASPYID